MRAATRGARGGSFLRLARAILSNSSSLIDSTICREAPRSFDFGWSPRLAASAAPAASAAAWILPA